MFADQWQEHIDSNSFVANPNIYVEHESFEKIVEMGSPAIPFIIEAYREGHLFWGAALVQITGNKDFGNGVTGNLRAQKDAWLKWARNADI